ncbi:MAG TPA: hypothetical protein PKE26_16595 [Kiritimatiellia bacterium]|nr:hypothetical protein [Saprospiraceae bacterium]HMP00716.1 hypothetical protein [Kiritimatiellia bacterium]
MNDIDKAMTILLQREEFKELADELVQELLKVQQPVSMMYYRMAYSDLPNKFYANSTELFQSLLSDPQSIIMELLLMTMLKSGSPDTFRSKEDFNAVNLLKLVEGFSTINGDLSSGTPYCVITFPTVESAGPVYSPYFVGLLKSPDRCFVIGKGAVKPIVLRLVLVKGHQTINSHCQPDREAFIKLLDDIDQGKSGDVIWTST